MLVIELTFLTGRFHATPWGRNVNEGVPEWPPSPYRLIRSLYDVWKRKRSDWSEDRIEPLMAALASEPPQFYLPPANASHTRSFLSQNEKDVTKKQRIFDAFVIVPKGSSVLAKWSHFNLDEDQESDLNQLLSLMNYLGRSESWVVARTVSGVEDAKWNCVPADGSSYVGDLEPVRVACPVPAQTYAADPYTTPPVTKRGKPKELSWLDALARSTADMQALHQSVPPAFQYVTYMRPAHCFEVKHLHRTSRPEPEINGVIYALRSKVPPSVTSTLEVSERIRRKLMGIHKRIVKDPRKVSPRFSGKDQDGKPLKGHQHVYVLPQDLDQDGWLDHILIFCKEPFTCQERLALDRLNKVWQSGGKPDIYFVPTSWGRIEDLIGDGTKTRFTSATPFVPPRHYRKGRGPFMEWLAQEVRREAVNHGLPEPVEVKPVGELMGHGRRVKWLEFRRNRKGDQPGIGYGFELVFSEPVDRPVALGYGAHFGLGLFVPA
jgi:CRISPR-associated protein Csb2